MKFIPKSCHLFKLGKFENNSNAKYAPLLILDACQRYAVLTESGILFLTIKLYLLRKYC